MKFSTVVGSRTLLVLAICVTAVTAFAQSATPADGAPALDLSTLYPLLIPLVVPILIAILKWATDSVPKPFLPILAPLLGAAADIAMSYATGTAMNPVLGAALGAAGVGVREIADQAKKSITEPAKS